MLTQHISIILKMHLQFLLNMHAFLFRCYPRSEVTYIYVCSVRRTYRCQHVIYLVKNGVRICHPLDNVNVRGATENCCGKAFMSLLEQPRLTVMRKTKVDSTSSCLDLT